MKYIPRPYGQLITDFELDLPRCAIWAGMGLGKEQANTEPVLTPHGWRPMGSLRTGDTVIGRSGTPVKVTGVFPQGEVDLWRCEFSDGSWTLAGGEHLWFVHTAKDRYAGKEGRVLTTTQILKEGIYDSYGNSRHFIPVVSAVEYSEKVLPIEPYLLGIILGDGRITKYGACSVTKDTELVEQWPGRTEEHPSAGISTRHFKIPGLLAAIKVLGLAGKRSWEKLCPPEYLLGSITQRHSLLQGLLDTDGYAMPDGGVEFSSTAEALVDAVVELTESLGGIARKKEPRVTRHQNGNGRPSWRVNCKLPPNFAPFRLERKLAKWRPPTKYQPTRSFKSITPAGRGEATCIAVSSADHLYVTRRHIVTHNTVCSLTAADGILFLEGGPVLVLAPKRVALTTWPAEIYKWDHLKHLRISPIVGDKADRISALQTPADIYTTNYDNLPWLIEQLGEKWPFRTVIADESTRLKSFRLRQGGARARALGTVAHTKIKRFIELTGTPSPNGLQDLWGQIWFIDAGKRLGRTFTSFSERWFRQHPDGYGMVPLPHAQEEITGLLHDVCLTIEPKDWFDLKDPIVTNIYVDLPPHVRNMYKQMEKEMFLQIEQHEIEAFNAAARTQKLLQIASGAVYLNPEVYEDSQPGARQWKTVHDEKLDALEDIIEEAAGMPVLVAYHFKSDLARLLKRFKSARRLDDDPQTIVDWNAGKIPILLSHPQSAGHGLNLQDGGNILVFFSHNWNLEDRLQIIERIGPMRQLQSGYERPVFIYNIIGRDTADEIVMERVRTKAEVQDLLKAAMRRRE